MIMMNINLNAVCEYLENKKNQARFIKNCDIELLLELQDKINNRIEVWREISEKEREEKALREKRRAELIMFINGEGFTLDELIAPQKKPKAKKRAMKYRYMENGKEKTWVGVGRTPQVIQKALDAGESLESFLIKDTNEGY